MITLPPTSPSFSKKPNPRSLRRKKTKRVFLISTILLFFFGIFLSLDYYFSGASIVNDIVSAGHVLHPSKHIPRAWVWEVRLWGNINKLFNKPCGNRKLGMILQCFVSLLNYSFSHKLKSSAALSSNFFISIYKLTKDFFLC